MCTMVASTHNLMKQTKFNCTCQSTRALPQSTHLPPQTSLESDSLNSFKCKMVVRQTSASATLRLTGVFLKGFGQQRGSMAQRDHRYQI